MLHCLIIRGATSSSAHIPFFSLALAQLALIPWNGDDLFLTIACLSLLGVIYHFHWVLFHRLSWCSDSAPNVCIHFVLIILPHVTFSAFILISGFKYFYIVPDFYMCSHALTFLSMCFNSVHNLSELLWHLIFLWLMLITFLIYPDAVYKPLYLPSSSSVCKLTLIHILLYILSKSLSILKSLSPLLVLW